MQKRILAVHDISCVGKCSLTVALPIISAAGIETSVLPTAVLSTHTGGFDGFAYFDMTDELEPVMAHWKSLGLKFDAIYTGYLGSIRQLELIERLLDMFGGEDTLIMVDPVMADNGELYSTFTPEFVSGMRQLCRRADMIVPNMTEAAMLTGEPYVGAGCTEEYVAELMKKLSDLGPEKVILSGVSTEAGMLGAAAYDKGSGEVFSYFTKEIHGFFPGTGDVFASALLSALVNGADFSDALKITVDFTVDSIARTKRAGTDSRYGVDFEHAIPDFVRHMKRLPGYGK